MVKIGLADDCPFLQLGLKEKLKRAPDLTLCWCSSDLEKLPTMLSEKLVQLLVFEIGLGGTGKGLHVLQELHERYPKLPIFVYTYRAEQEMVVASFRSGAVGFLPKGSPEKDFFAGIRKVLAGEKFIPLQYLEQLALLYAADGPAHDSFERLSNREKQVFEELAAGHSNKEIADRLNIRVQTVSTYKRRIFDKLGLQSIVDLGRFAERQRRQN